MSHRDGRSLLLAGLLLTALVVVLLFFLPRIAVAQMFSPPQCIAKVAPLAKRLHVKPAVQNSPLMVLGCDGKQYDILALVGAVLDRLDKMEKKTR